MYACQHTNCTTIDQVRFMKLEGCELDVIPYDIYKVEAPITSKQESLHMFKRNDSGELFFLQRETYSKKKDFFWFF